MHQFIWQEHTNSFILASLHCLHLVSLQRPCLNLHLQQMCNICNKHTKWACFMLWFSCNILNSEHIPKQPLPLPDTQSVFCGLDDWTDPRAGLRMTVSRQNTDSSGRVHLTSPVPTNMMSLYLLYLCIFDLLNKGAGEQKRSRLWRMRNISPLKRVCVPGRPTEPCEHPSG